MSGAAVRFPTRQVLVTLLVPHMDALLLPALDVTRRPVEACVSRRPPAVLLDRLIIDWIEEDL